MLVGQKLEKILADDIVPFASMAHVEEFRKHMKSEEMQSVLTVVKPELELVFSHFAKLDHKDGRRKTVNHMELERMLVSANIVGGRLVKGDIDNILGLVQAKSLAPSP